MRINILPIFIMMLASSCAPALYMPARHGEMKAVRSLLDKGEDPNKPWNFMLKETPLHAAVSEAQIDTARILIEHGADPNLKTRPGAGNATPLHYAVCVGHIGMVKLLLENGADPEPGVGRCDPRTPAKERIGTPLELAEKNNFSAVAALIEAALGKKLGLFIDGGKIKRANGFGPIANELVGGFESGGKAIVVTNFSYVDGRASKDGRILAERLTTELVKRKQLTVVERNAMEQVFAELKLHQTGAVDPTTAKNLGKMLGADWVVVGTVAELDHPQLELNVRLVGVESGKIMSAVNGSVDKNWKD